LADERFSASSILSSMTFWKCRYRKAGGLHRKTGAISSTSRGNRNFNCTLPATSGKVHQKEGI
jgi:hypothetical protein